MAASTVLCRERATRSPALPVPCEELALGRIDRTLVDIDFAFRRGHVSTPEVGVVVERSINSVGIALQDRTVPESLQNLRCPCFTDTFGEVFRNFHVLTGAREDLVE